MRREPIACEVDGQPCYQYPVGKKLWALIDAIDLELVSAHRWYMNGNGYAFTRFKPRRRPRTISMHRLIYGAPCGLEVDHINHNGVDNRRCNLRQTTRSQNSQNRRGASSNSKTGIRGVFACDKGKIRAQVCVNGRRIQVGYFPTVEEAEKATRAARAKYMTHSPECTTT